MSAVALRHPAHFRAFINQAGRKQESMVTKQNSTCRTINAWWLVPVSMLPTADRHRLPTPQVPASVMVRREQNRLKVRPAPREDIAAGFGLAPQITSALARPAPQLATKLAPSQFRPAQPAAAIKPISVDAKLMAFMEEIGNLGA